jgi:hypothetical protein
MTPAPMKPMHAFDPTRPALLHDQLNGKIIPWSAAPEEVKSWRQHANTHNEGVIEWEGLLLDGWCEPLGN